MSHSVESTLDDKNGHDEWITVRSARRNTGAAQQRLAGSRLESRVNTTVVNSQADNDASEVEMNTTLVERFGRRNATQASDDQSYDPRSSSLTDHINALRDYMVTTKRQARIASADSWLSVPEIPTTDELFDPSKDRSVFASFDSEDEDDDELDAPENIIDGPWDSKEQYLSSHHALLREDATRPLRQAIDEIRRHPEMMEYELNKSTIGIYDDVYITGVTFAPRGVATRVVFSYGRIGKKIRWEQSKRLLSGSLIALTPADDMFASKCIIGVIAARPLIGLQENPPVIDVYLRPEDQELDCQRKWVMIEERAGFFEAERHTLMALQKLMTESFPFQEHLVALRQAVRAPEYLVTQPHADMSSVFGSSSEYTNVDMLNHWPKNPSTTLDISQLRALERLLTKRLAVVQGPPGTGKTHVSLAALRILLANMKPGDPPIIIACQTNHALDQILRHVMNFEPLVARLGGRSKDPEVKTRTLYELKNKMKKKPVVPGGSKHSATTEMRKLATDVTTKLLSTLEKGKGLKDHEILGTLGIITSAQAESLERGDTEYVTHESVIAGKSQLHIWLGKALVFTKAQHLPIDLGFDFEDADLEFEQVRELEAEQMLQEDDLEILRGQYLAIADNITGKNANLPLAQVEALLRTPNLWRIPHKYRGSIFCHWQQQMKEIVVKTFRQKAAEYNALTSKRQTGAWEEALVVLAGQKVIGLTTTGLSKNRALLYALKPKIVLIEEAAETLEAPVIAACLPSVEHLMLVGDHQQLRPHTHVQKLEGPPFNLNVSLFERLVRNGVEFAMLKRQRRMIPEIRRILKPIYGEAIKDHPSVKDLAVRPPIPGMNGVNSFFFTHEWRESFDDTMSAINDMEAEMVVGFYKYLVFNGTKDEEITVLTFYNGQRKQILRLLHSNDELIGRTFKVVTVDSYQGEENKVILLSLVRSNANGNIGFLRVDNRVCVALSRAKCGFYIFGNAEMLCCTSKTWAEIITIMWEKGEEKEKEASHTRSRRIGYHMPLQCINHEQRTWIDDPSDWAGNFGGCMQSCRDTLPCGHKCILRCHPFSHGLVNCSQICSLILQCGHTCQRFCSDECHCSICGRDGDTSNSPRRPSPDNLFSKNISTEERDRKQSEIQGDLHRYQEHVGRDIPARQSTWPKLPATEPMTPEKNPASSVEEDLLDFKSPIVQVLRTVKSIKATAELPLHPDLLPFGGLAIEERMAALGTSRRKPLSKTSKVFDVAWDSHEDRRKYILDADDPDNKPDKRASDVKIEKIPAKDHVNDPKEFNTYLSGTATNKKKDKPRQGRKRSEIIDISNATSTDFGSSATGALYPPISFGKKSFARMTSTENQLHTARDTSSVMSSVHEDIDLISFD